MDDSALCHEVKRVLGREPRLHGKGIAVTVADGVVCLTGEVATLAEKRLAVNLVRQLRANGPIRDALHLPLAKDRSDAEIAERARRHIEYDGALRARRFEVAAKDGVVTLSGITDNIEEKQLAGVWAWWVPGVVDVDNQILVVPEHRGTDADMVDLIRTVFEMDHLIDENNLDVAAAGGRVALLGTARSEEERLAAEHDCYYVLGVESVDNRLVVVPV